MHHRETSLPSSSTPPIVLRWTIGDVAERGFEALRLSAWGAWNVFGPAAQYVVCVNTLGLAEARRRAGSLPASITWRRSTHDEVPDFLVRAFGQELAGGMGWKLAPPRLYPDHYEIALDNDCILWSCPPSLRAWLDGSGGPQACLMAEDVVPCYAQFAPLCPTRGVNAGLRGVPPGFDFDDALRTAIGALESRVQGPLTLAADDEQGLQVAALSLRAPLQLVSLRELTVCSPFYPHLSWLGECGAHFVGINARHIAWDYYDRPADAWLAEHWERHLPELARRTLPADLSGRPADTAQDPASPPSAGSPRQSHRPPAAPSARVLPSAPSS